MEAAVSAAEDHTLPAEHNSPDQSGYMTRLDPLYGSVGSVHSVNQLSALCCYADSDSSSSEEDPEEALAAHPTSNNNSAPVKRKCAATTVFDKIKQISI